MAEIESYCTPSFDLDTSGLGNITAFFLSILFILFKSILVPAWQACPMSFGCLIPFNDVCHLPFSFNSTQPWPAGGWDKRQKQCHVQLKPGVLSFLSSIYRMHGSNHSVLSTSIFQRRRKHANTHTHTSSWCWHSDFSFLWSGVRRVRHVIWFIEPSSVF